MGSKKKNGSWHDSGTNSVVWLRCQRVSTREVQPRIRMHTEPIPYNLAIWFMAYSMLSSNIHFNCTVFIVDLIKSCSLSGRNAGTCTYTFLYVLNGKNTKQCWVSDSISVHVRWEITCCINSTLSQKRAGRNNHHNFKAVNVFSCTSGDYLFLHFGNRLLTTALKFTDFS